MTEAGGEAGGEECGWTARSRGSVPGEPEEEPADRHLHFWAQQAAVGWGRCRGTRGAESAWLVRVLRPAWVVEGGEWMGRWGCKKMGEEEAEVGEEVPGGCPAGWGTSRVQRRLEVEGRSPLRSDPLVQQSETGKVEEGEEE